MSMLEQLPSLNIFMLCTQVNKTAYREMPENYVFAYVVRITNHIITFAASR